jgi:hypothetical protein
MKRCSVCKEEKEVEKFYSDPAHKDGRRSDCIKCHNDRQAERRKIWQQKPSGLVYKTCSFCKEAKLVSLFHKDCRQQDGYGPRCIECKKLHHKAYQKDFRVEHRKERRAYELRRKYGLTKEESLALVEKSMIGLCDICGRTEQHATKKSLSIDHNHLTNKIRGLLCHDCNLTIAHANENTQTLQNAILYIDSHQ